MSLPVPLSVRIGDQHVTKQVQALSFRREAVGGVRSISFSLARSLTDLDGIDPLAKVSVYDTRTAVTVADGRLSDTGRGASADGPRWECLAFGPAQHASDITTPLIYVDRGLDGWRQYANSQPGAGPNFAAGQQPSVTSSAQGLLASWPDGTPVTSGALIAIRYDGIREAGLKLARVGYNWVNGFTSSAWANEAIISTAGSWTPGQYEPLSDTWSTTPGATVGHVGTDFANGRDIVDLRTAYYGADGTLVGDTGWAHFLPVVEALRLNQAGAEFVTGYSGVVRPNQVVADLLGRMLPEFDGANALIDTSSTYDIDQLAYPDAVTAEQVLSDLMALEPGYRWYTTPDTGNGYGFSWAPWPTTVRYEATLDDGGTFPLSTQGVYNAVIVGWTDEGGRPRTTRVTATSNAILDAVGLTRQASIALGREMGSEANAAAAGATFLENQAVPKNSGTLTVARPIRDVITGAMVNPWEIEPGELVRIRGVEAYPDAFNADTNDGQGVFRIFAVDYTTEGNTATLALDSDPQSTEDALVKLLNQRNRR